ncbi:type II toxin -antitoxin system TacA 1-like antitoxin [Mesorhizobium sp. PUT5]|uniref:type II toxin -antitoxin system TacA 1-like antitoxin n=1 Tax=Mesorhizobium sp. PUT5 TaxID=3454629 RepID=UPI003FA46DB4
MAKTASLALRIAPATKDALEEAARADKRTVSNYVEKIITEDLEAKGFLPVPVQAAE